MSERGGRSSKRAEASERYTMSEQTPMKLTVDEPGRVDKALAKHFPDAGRRQLAELFDQGAVKVAGKRAKKGDRVAAGDVIELAHAPPTGDALRPIGDPDVVLDILLERPELVAIAKPAGVPSQPLRAGERGTIANGLVARWPEQAQLGPEAEPGGPAPTRIDPRDGGLVHRLDIGTSGVLVAARTADAYRALRAAFGAGQIAKDYLAIVDGRPVARDCELPLAQRGNHVVVDHTDGLPAHTTFVVERATETHALVRCTARTGRMHQVRAHLAQVGAPIVGDTLYGGSPHDAGFFLHAGRLELPGPIVVEAPLPARFVAALAALALDR